MMSTMSFPAEFTFVATACRWPLSDDQAAELRRLIDGGLDWGRAARVVRRQRVAGLVQNALRFAGIEAPSEFSKPVGDMAQGISRQNLLAAMETARLQRLFDGEGIPVVFLKGLSLARLVYGSLSFKHGRDIDVLVPPAHAKEAWRLLERARYRLMNPDEGLDERRRDAVVRYGRELELLHKDGFPLDLHWSLASNPGLLDEGKVWSDARSVAVIDGVEVLTLGDADLFAYLCVHGASHAWSRLKWLADVNALLALKSEAEIVDLYRQSQTRGAGLCAGQALLLRQRLFDVAPPEALKGELDGERRLRRLAAIALDAMVGQDGETELVNRKFGMPAGYLIYLSHALLGRGPRYHLAQLRLFFVSVGDRVRYPLPEPLHFLYPVLRLPLLAARSVKFGRRDAHRPV